MRLSVDGLRRNSTNDFNELVDLLKQNMSHLNEMCDIHDLERLVDQVGNNIATFNCCFDDENELFNDMSDSLDVKTLCEIDE